MRYVLALIIVLGASVVRAQTFPIDTLRYAGDPKSHINVVIMGDGYTASEQKTFLSDAQSMSDYIFSQSPWKNYRPYFNIFAIEVPSLESGTTHPNTAPDCAGSGVPVIAVNTYFGCSFDAFGIHRLVVPNNVSAVAQVLAMNFPNYDQVMIVAHSPYYGGSGGDYATGTVNTSSDEVIAHEIGHSFAGLADEYWAGSQYAAEKPNMTQDSDPSHIRWKNWLPSGLVGIYPYTGDPTWFKPSESCKMQALGNPYCSVCQEAIVEKVHSLVSPLISYSPKSLSVDLTSTPITFALDTVVTPIPNTLRTTWTLDGTPCSTTGTTLVLDPSAIAQGQHTLIASMLDTTGLVRIDEHFTEHVSTVTWTLTKAQGLVIDARQNRIATSLYPNPATSFVHIVVNSHDPEPISIDLYSASGSRVKHLSSAALSTSFTDELSIADLPAGVYVVRYSIGSVITSQNLVRQ